MSNSISENYVSILGGINIDIKGISETDGFRSGSHPGKVHFAPGGVALNIAENLSLLEIPVKLFGCIGDDHFGEFIMNDISSKGVFTDHVLRIPKIRTSVCLSISDKNNKFYYAVNDMESCMEHITKDYIWKNINSLKQSKFIVMDTNLSSEVLNEVTNLANKNEIPVFIDTVSEVKAEKILSIKGFIDFLSPNRSEFEKLFGEYKKKDDLLNMLKGGIFRKYKNVLLKKDKEGVDVISPENMKIFNIKPIQLKVKESSGAGDAFNAGFIFSILNKNENLTDLTNAAESGMCAAYFALRSFDSVSGELNKNKLIKLFNKKYK